MTGKLTKSVIYMLFMCVNQYVIGVISTSVSKISKNDEFLKNFAKILISGVRLQKTEKTEE